MKNVFMLLVLALLLSCATISPAGLASTDTISTDAMCSAVFIMVADFENDKEDTNERQLAYYDSLSYLISWEQSRSGVSVAFYNQFVQRYRKNMDSSTWLLHWPRCIHRANDIYPEFMKSRK